MSEPLPTYTRRDQTRPDWAHNYSRPNDVPPSYADSVRWFFYNSLRPAFLVASLVSAIGAAILCGVQWRSMGETTGKAHIFSLVSAVLFTAVAVFQFYAFMAGLNSHISMLRSAVRLSYVSIGLALAAIAVSLANVYGNHDSIMTQCITAASGQGDDVEEAGPVDTTTETASDYCRYDWNTDTVWNITWLVIIVLFGAFYFVLATRYLNKVENPGFSDARSRPLAADDNHDFEADMDGPNGYAMGGLGRRSSQDTLAANDEAMIDAKLDPMADVYGGRRDLSDVEADGERASVDYPRISRESDRDEFTSVAEHRYGEPATIIPLSRPAPAATGEKPGAM